ncbi:MAG: Type 1 glutamine amidotransferase-like domain-containing protein [bacterium]
MKLLLTSAGLTHQYIVDCFLTEIPCLVHNARILIIAYAQTEVEQYYVQASYNELEIMGCHKIAVYNMHTEQNVPSEEYDAIYVCGGNTFAILQKIRIIGLDTFILECVKKGSLYIGVSAGSIIAGPTIDIAGWGSAGDENDVGLQDLSGLGLTNVSIFPHFREGLQKEVEAFREKVSFPVVTLTDRQALMTVGEEQYLVT